MLTKHYLNYCTLLIVRHNTTKGVSHASVMTAMSPKSDEVNANNSKAVLHHALL